MMYECVSRCSLQRVSGLAVITFILILSALTACTPQKKNVAALEQGLTDLLELRTYEQVYHAVGYLNRQQSILFFKTIDRELLYAVDIHIQAGIDLRTGVRIVESPFDRGVLTVFLPAARVLISDADESSIRRYFSRSLGGEVSLLEYGDQIAELKQRAEQQAVDSGILQRAEENARAVVRSYLLQAGVREVRFTGRQLLE